MFASRCGFTRICWLYSVWRDYRDRGLVVLGFPCDQFGHQEPGDEAAIRDFCFAQLRRGLPVVRQDRCKRSRRHPLWRWLKDEKSGLLGIDAIKWNFTKFLVGRDGAVIKRYAPGDEPESLRTAIETALAA